MLLLFFKCFTVVVMVQVSFIRKDFEEERKDRERMASEIDIAKGKWEVKTQELVCLLISYLQSC